MTATSTIAPEEVDEAPVGPSAGWHTRLPSWLANREGIATFLVVAACVVFTFKELQPSQLFRNTTPAGGDMGAHVWLPAYVKSSLLPHLRITGWTPDWYDGFPALTFYFPGPIVAIALLSYVIPYNIAFKLVTVLGLLTLPVAAWAFGRLARMRFPGPACLALATLPYLFGREFTIYGGNIASTMAGEFCFSIALSLALVFLGVVARGLEDGRHRALAAVLLAAVGICHILPLFFAIGGAIVLTLMRFDRRRLQWTIPVLAVGILLIAFWALPFYARLPYATNMGYQKLTTYFSSLFPGSDTWLLVLAGIGAILALARRNRVGTFLIIMTVLSGVIFRIAPQARLWNARVLPFWFLCLYLLAGVAFMELGTMAVEHFRDSEVRRGALIGVPIVTGIIAFAWVNYPLRNLPFGHVTASGKYSWLGITSSDSSFVPSWVYWNYSGYQSTGKARKNEYFALINKMTELGKDPNYGCGTAMWEYEPELDQMGTPDALMLLPYWTHGCIGSEEGLYYESSATTPYHFLNAAELSDQPSNPVRGLDYPTGPNVAEGIEHLQMLGDKYFMAETPDIEAAADADSSLRLIATVGPFPVTYSGSTNSVQKRTWNIYEILDSAPVAPLSYQPVVMTGVSGGGQAWLTASESWYLDPSRWDVYEAASGPKSWARVSATATTLPRTKLPPVQVSNIHEGTESISFNVDRVGVPVVVRTSYFPNWSVSGATGVYRVTPNLMVVVPTADHVTLTYGYTTVDWIGFVLSLFGLLGVALLWRVPGVVYPRPRHFLGRDSRYERPRHFAAKVRGEMPALESASLAAVFKAYDIRGVVPDQLDSNLARAVGTAFAGFAGAPRVLVARDMRPSGPALTAAFADGVTAAGVDVVELGLASSSTSHRAAWTHLAPCSPPRTIRPGTTGSSCAWPGRDRWEPTPGCARSWPRWNASVGRATRRRPSRGR
jgi:Phosphoglucomutase/phosphomannomutase, alpha/beta/alpha domain I